MMLKEKRIKESLHNGLKKFYTELIHKPAFKNLDIAPVEQVHNGYFSQDKKGRLKDTNGETQADDDTYNLIMKDKEKLLDIANPLRFIFSHSALREGWDNPNVFQICTLNETKSEMKKRQEIGRGLRLAVNQDGRRIYDQNINRLTVVANESYNDFAKTLQQEIETDCGVDFSGRIKPKRERVLVKYRKGFEADPRFLEIWERLKRKTTYRVNYSTEKLIADASKAVKELPSISEPSIRATKVKVVMTDEGVDTNFVAENPVSYEKHYWAIPDISGYIQNKTELTRSTIMAILVGSGRLGDVLKNPQQFLDLTSEAIKRVLYKLMIDGIKYQKIGDSEYEMKLFEAEDLEIYLNDFTFKVGSTDVSGADKTIYEEFVPLDSAVETQFAKDCESSEQVRFYFKLPNWFKIPTPIGNYNPDWAVVFEDDKKIYFVAETKDTGTQTVDLTKLHESEQQKIKCGIAHFKEFPDLEYKVTNKVKNLFS
jgi:type III restriction enzyme